MQTEYDYTPLPEHLRSGAKLYVEDGILPGSFMRGVICNNLSETLGHAHPSIMFSVLKDIVHWWNNVPPALCHGSRKAMIDWHEIGGLKGYNETLKGGGATETS